MIVRYDAPLIPDDVKWSLSSFERTKSWRLWHTPSGKQTGYMITQDDGVFAVYALEDTRTTMFDTDLDEYEITACDTFAEAEDAVWEHNGDLFSVR